MSGSIKAPTTQNNFEELLNEVASRTFDTAAYFDAASAAWETTARHIEIELLAYRRACCMVPRLAHEPFPAPTLPVRKNSAMSIFCMS